MGYSHVLGLTVLREPTYRESLSWEEGKGGDLGCCMFWGYRVPFILHPSVHTGLRWDAGLTEASHLTAPLASFRAALGRRREEEPALCVFYCAGGGDVLLPSAVPMASMTLGWPQITEKPCPSSARQGRGAL